VKIGRTKRTAAKNRDNRLSFAADNLPPHCTKVTLFWAR
jgi:hypothetical protein